MEFDHLLFRGADFVCRHFLLAQCVVTFSAERRFRIFWGDILCRIFAGVFQRPVLMGLYTARAHLLPLFLSVFYTAWLDDGGPELTA